MQIIKDRTVVEDEWQHANGEPGDALPDGKIIVSLARWKADKDSLMRRKNSGLGIWLEPDERADDIAEDIEHFQVIAVNFPVFRDGRGFSTARLLRERFGYAGELRAVGDVLRDQIFYMHRCGFDAFEVRADRDINDALKAFDEFSVKYQPAGDEKLPLWRRRS